MKSTTYFLGTGNTLITYISTSPHMIVSQGRSDSKQKLVGKILEANDKASSRFGNIIKSRTAFIVVEEPDEVVGVEYNFWNFCGETYITRIKDLIGIAAERLERSPFTRRVSIPVWKSEDHLCGNPPALTEVSFLQMEGNLHVTAYIRSLDALNYYDFNFDLVNYILQEVVNATEFEKGTMAMIIAIPHIYSRDYDRALEMSRDAEEVFGVTEYGAHLVEDYFSTAWHSSLEAIYHQGKKKQTEWGEIFEGQAESRFIHRLLVEVENPYEMQIHDKAPFSRKYGIGYAHDYVICAKYIDSEVKEDILKEEEAYTYAERARYCQYDEQHIDQLYTVINKLKQDRNRRDCYVGISRQWDIESDEPPCLRGYQFCSENSDELSGLFYMRSNDAYGAMHANMFAFSTLTQYVTELIGSKRHRYYHFALDAHIYSEFLEAVEDLLKPQTPTYSSG
ncbi:MAG: thymidylate synthase [Archaeoglobaceae archaeon]